MYKAASLGGHWQFPFDISQKAATGPRFIQSNVPSGIDAGYRISLGQLVFFLAPKPADQLLNDTSANLRCGCMEDQAPQQEKPKGCLGRLGRLVVF